MRLAASLQRLLLGPSLGLCMGSVPARALEVLEIDLTLAGTGFRIKLGELDSADS